MLSCCKEMRCRAKINTVPGPDEDVIKKLASVVSPAPSPDFSLGECLQSVYPLLDFVFAYLSYTDLLSASKVCQAWRETAQKHIKARREVAWFSVHGRNRQYEMQRSKNLLLCDAHFCFILLNPRMLALSSNICVEYSGQHSCCKVSEYLQKTIVGHPFRETYLIVSNNVTSHLDCTEKAERYTADRSAIKALTIPEIPNTRIAFIQPDSTDDAFLRNRYVKPSETVSGLLVFCSHNQRSNVNNFLRHLLRGQEPQEVGIAGGILPGARKHFVGPELCTNPVSRDDCDVHCIAFLQPKDKECSLLSHSLVVRQGRTFEGVEKELIRFKEEIVLRSQSAAFRFSCASKQVSRQEETFAFNNIFPNTPVIGIDVDGEIGWDTIGKTLLFNKILKTEIIIMYQSPDIDGSSDIALKLFNHPLLKTLYTARDPDVANYHFYSMSGQRSFCSLLGISNG